jgi:hypothetical protein
MEQAIGLGSLEIYKVLLQKMCQHFCHIHFILLIEHHQAPKVCLAIYIWECGQPRTCYNWCSVQGHLGIC